MYTISIEKRPLLFNIIKWLTYAVAFSLPVLKPHWHSKIILVLVIVWLIALPAREIWEKVRQSKFVWLLCGLVLFDVVGLLHTENLHFGIKYLESKFTLVVFPAFFLTILPYYDKRFTDNIILFFLAGVLLVFAYLLILAFRSPEINDIGYFFLHRATEISGIRDQSFLYVHPSYLSLYTSMCIFYLFGNRLQTKDISRAWKLVIGVLLAILVILMVWLNARASMAGFGLAGIIYILFRLSSKKRLIAIAFFIACGFLILTMPVTRERFIDAPIRALKAGAVVHLKDPVSWSISFRLQILECNLELVENGNWIFGYGTGDYRDRLTKCFYDHNFTWLMARDFDSHSEFFGQLHRHGILGLLLFVVCLVVPFINAVRARNLFFIIFTILIISSSITESLFSLQRGIVFYTFFGSLLFFEPRIFPSKTVRSDWQP